MQGKANAFWDSTNIDYEYMNIIAESFSTIQTCNPSVDISYSIIPYNQSHKMQKKEKEKRNTQKEHSLMMLEQTVGGWRMMMMWLGFLVLFISVGGETDFILLL